MGWGKVVRWSIKAAISLKRLKIEEKLLWRAYRNSPTLFRTAPSPTPYGRIFPKTGGSQPPPKTPIAIISGTGEATDFKFGLNIQRVNPIKNFEEKGAWAYPETAQFLGTRITSGTGKATNFKFGRSIHSVHPNKSPFKMLEKRERGRIQGLSTFFGYPLLSREGKSYGFQIWPVHSECPSE